MSDTDEAEGAAPACAVATWGQVQQWTAHPLLPGTGAVAWKKRLLNRSMDPEMATRALLRACSPSGSGLTVQVEGKRLAIPEPGQAEACVMPFTTSAVFAAIQGCTSQIAVLQLCARCMFRCASGRLTGLSVGCVRRSRPGHLQACCKPSPCCMHSSCTYTTGWSTRKRAQPLQQLSQGPRSSGTGMHGWVAGSAWRRAQPGCGLRTRKAEPGA